METIIIIAIAITVALLVGVSIKSNRSKKEDIDPLSPTQVKKEEKPEEEKKQQLHQ